MITYPIGLLSQKVSSFDTDAQAFITAASITDTTQQNAINDLVVSLKDNSLWTKMNAIYPIVGGAASSHKYNLKDPQDTDGAFRLTFNGTVTHSSGGMLGDGSTGFANTHFIPSSELTDEKLHLSFYSRTNITAFAIDIGARGTVGTTKDSFFTLRGGSGNSGFRINLGADILLADTDSLGFYMASRESINLQKAYKNNSFVGQNTSVSTSITDVPIYILGLNNNGSLSNQSIRQCAFASMGEELNSTDALNLYTIVNDYQTALSRNV